MSKKCQISGKVRQSGHNVSHANNKTKRTFEPNLQRKKIFVPALGKAVRMKLSTRVIRTIDKIGFDAAIRKHGLKVSDLNVN